jgi:hypothetical protein
MRKDQLPRELIEKIADPKIRRQLGLWTPSEVLTANEVREEKELHIQVISLLYRNDIVYVHASMFKRSTLPAGYPDFSFVYLGIPVAWELKVGKNTTSIEQNKMISKLDENGWLVYILRSLTECQACLDRIREQKAA